MTGERRDDWCPHEELAVGWAMHSLEPDEEALLRAHLPGCARCQETVRSTEEVTAALGGSVQQYDPPARLKARLMTAVEHTPQEHATPVVARPIPLDRKRNTAPRLLAAAAAVVLVAAVVFGGVRIGQLGDQVAEQQQRVALLDQALRMAADPDTNRAVLRSESGDKLGVLLSGTDDAMVVETALPPNNASDQVYVVWGASTPEPVALATFDVKSGGLERLTWSQEAHKHQLFAISLEPGRTAPAKPTNKLASGQVEAS
ncbi:anti-sigma-K factor rskA [Saccharothrix variisporea]|uniref:Regulator of SigK n=2 Tax=Saccharothrix variisporea TaxID=543527 RepID=A0A495X4P5_9PSEU|nr:anti-sigma-K factor rskA [Saccharothrix variisporea]